MIFIAGSCSFAISETWRYLFGDLGQERHGARPPDGAGELTLMPGAAAGDSSRSDLPPLRHEVLQSADILVVDELHLVHTELADFTPAEPAPLEWFARWRNLPVLLEGNFVFPFGC